MADDVRARVAASFGQQGLMAHLGARLSHVARGRGPDRAAEPARGDPAARLLPRRRPSAIADTAGGYAALTVFGAEDEVLTVEYKINLLAPALGDHLEAVGTVLRSGRTLTVCRLEVYAVRADERSMVAAGQQTLIRVAG